MADALEDPLYFSIVEIIADSLHQHPPASIHDLLDAYATFVSRVRSQSTRLEACSTSLPALAPLSAHKDNFIRALRRDVRLAHTDPLSPLSRPSLSVDELFLADSIHLNIGVDAIQHARDSSSLCHHALCALTTILRFPAFHSVFHEHHLSMLFGDILDIALADHLPTLNKAKTYSLSLWALSCHRLPATVLSSRQDDVFSALQRSLDGTRQPGNIVLDGLKAIAYTIERPQSGFLDLFSPLLPRVMVNLWCESSELRLHASNTLGKFANALIHQNEFSPLKWQTLSDRITSCLESYCDESRAKCGSRSFSSIVQAAFSALPSARSWDIPTWVHAVLASWIVLSGPMLYRKPTVLRFILQVLALTLTHKRSVVRALHSHVWRCFVWTFSQMLLSPDEPEPELISSAFYVIRQEVSGGIGVALVHVLLSVRMSAIRPDGRRDRMSQALSVIEAMVRTECKHTRQEGFVLLQALTDGAQVGPQASQNVYEFPASILLNGAIVNATWDSLPSVIHSIPKIPLCLCGLDETEISRNYKSLLVIWKDFAIKADRKDLSPDLIDVWLSILHAYSRQLECEPIARTMEVLRYTAATIVEFLPSVAIEGPQPNWGSWDILDQLSSLTFISQLWSAMRKAFPTLADAAALILSSILKYAFHVLDLDVRILWSKLCADLMTTAPRSFLRDMQDRSAAQLVIHDQRELWGVIATSLSPSDPGLDWEDLVVFLAIPVCTWVLSDLELEAWEALLWGAVTLSGDCAMVVEHFTSEYFQRAEVETWESIIAVLCLLLACTHEYGNTPTDELLSVVDVCLTVSYGQASKSPETLMHSLQLLKLIGQVMALTADEVMRVLPTLCSSLCLWIEDHDGVMSDAEFNSVIVALYCEVLKALETLPLSVQILQDTECFLASAFSRIPTPAIAPFAFERFWRATYHGHSEFYHLLPPKIKSCLACFVTAYGGDLFDGLSLATGSQSQSFNDGSHLQIPTNHPGSECSEFGRRISPPPASVSGEVRQEVFNPDVASNREKDTAFLIHSSDDDVFQPTVLRQLREHSSHMDRSSRNLSERSASGTRTCLSPVVPPRGETSSPQSPQRIRLVVPQAPDRKRKLAEDDNVPQKRSRTSRNMLRVIRKLDSEPASRDVTPIDVPRTSSMPLNKKMVFDGVQVPNIRAVSHQRAMQAEQGCVSVAPTPSSRSARRESKTPPSDGGLDWEDMHVGATSSEADVDQSLLTAGPSSPLMSVLHEPDNGLPIHPGPSLQKAMSHIEGSPSAHVLPSPRRVKTTSARLDVLQDVYSSVANGASQIPMSELLQATKLVHRIGAMLTEQIGKKMGGPS